jgi:tetratricopeptide (TPR) repeat protein
LNQAFAEGTEADFIMPKNAWGIYPPAPLPAQGGTAVRAGGGGLAAAADSVMRQYISREIRPQAEALRRQLSANPSAALYNRGNLALIENDYAAAEQWFRQALAREPENRAALKGLEQIEERGFENVPAYRGIQ